MEYKLLGECCSKIGSGATPKGGAMVYVNDGVSFIRSQNVYNDGFAYEGLAHIVDEAAEKLRSVTVAENDVLINITGDSVARCCCVPVNVLPARVNQHVAILRAKSDVVNYRYLHYSLVMPSMQQYLLGIAHSQGASRGALTKGFLEKLALPLFPLPTQRKIAKVLSAYDDLIENNTKRIRILERMAEELYKEWFVRFRFPGHEKAKFVNGLPEGWRVERLNKLLDIRYGKDHKNISDGDIPIFGSGGVMRYGSKAQYDGESVLIPRKGSLNNIMYFNGPFWTVDTIFYSIPLVKHIAKYMYFALAGYDMESFNTGAALPSMTTEILSHFKIVVPAEAILQRFDQHLSSLFSEKDLLQRQNALLARQRDLLLPRLMSGKLSVGGVG